MVFCRRYRIYAKLCTNNCKKLDMNLGPLSVRSFAGVPKLPIQWSIKIAATVVAVFFAIDIALVSFERGMPSRQCIGCHSLFLKNPKMSMAISSSGSVTGKKRYFSLLSPCLLVTHQWFTALHGSVHVVYNVSPVVLCAHFLVHTPFSWVSCECRVVA